MIKGLMLFLLLLCLANSSYGQAKFGDNRSVIQPGALVELESTNKGLLNVRMNTSQMLTIPINAQSKGMMIFNTDSACLCVYNGLVWSSICNNVRQVKVVYTAHTGDSTFMCPSIVYDENNVQVFRNGVQINFSATVGTNLVKLEYEAICKKDDEIKIVQFIRP
jgi:CRISPR/Cas system-associated protein Csx1